MEKSTWPWWYQSELKYQNMHIEYYTKKWYYDLSYLLFTVVNNCQEGARWNDRGLGYHVGNEREDCHIAGLREWWVRAIKIKLIN